MEHGNQKAKGVRFARNAFFIFPFAKGKDCFN